MPVATSAASARHRLARLVRGHDQVPVRGRPVDGIIGPNDTDSLVRARS